MNTLRFDPTKKLGKFKILNATNGGPWYKRHANDQFRSNYDNYKAARIPYSRNHDSGVLGIYGGPYSHDITRIFPNFDADVNDPASYEFPCTDESILACLAAGTETFFRLGQTIEHQIKKYGILPPKDFQKWAEICEHIIMHYNYGWANGFELGIKYWEIWNEPDLDRDDSTNKRTWGGTKAQFFDMYEIAAKHLKASFPELMIGGPAIAGHIEWGEDFLREMQKREVPIDFFSWHIYATTPEKIVERGEKVKVLLDKYGYGDAESILNEYNYVKGWTDDFLYSIKMIHGLKNAGFLLSTMALSQRAPIDMLMYYDTRPSAFCGIFDFYTYEPLKAYYPLKWFGEFYDMDAEIRSENEIDSIYSLCGVDADGKILCMLTNYSENDNAPEKEISLDFGKEGKYEIYLVDSERNGELFEVTSAPCVKLPIHACALIKEI
ncbi:MAG: hypothetical protein IJZ03_03195 [Clostridia bacterium]|nr:hypothetical protein [Clostridia bacterium]